jgi:hypothetical protein
MLLHGAARLLLLLLSLMQLALCAEDFYKVRDNSAPRRKQQLTPMPCRSWG